MTSDAETATQFDKMRDGNAPSTNLDREIPKENVTSWSNGFMR